jgi:hypothetical protein
MNNSSVKPTITNPISNVLGSTATKSASYMIPSNTNTSGSFFSNMSWTTTTLLILFLFFFGFGLFVYLAKGTEGAVDYIVKLFVTVIQKIMHFFGNDSVDFSKEDTSTTESSSSSSVGGSNSTSTTSPTEPSSTTTTNIDKHMQNDHGVMGKPVTQLNAAEETSSEMQKDTIREDNLNKALNSAKPNLTHKNEPSYNADDSYSSIQMSKSSSKSGWCFIGEDRGFRSCIQVGNNDKCMSGDIFPSQEICINPKLRS